jgi:putative glutamine amidotransferase
MTVPLIAVPVAEFSHDGRSLYAINAPYVAALRAAGALPVLLPVCDPPDDLVAHLGAFAGLLLAGGGDVCPEFYGQPGTSHITGADPVRDVAELALTRAALEHGLPILGICRGAQLLSVAAGGSLHQDIQSSHPAALDHRYRAGNPRGHLAHPVRLQHDSLLACCLGAAHQEQVAVNSMHHQAVDTPPSGFRVTAWAPDGIIEAIEANGNGQRYALGVQWHPEELVPHHALMVALFRSFVQACSGRACQGRACPGRP